MFSISEGLDLVIAAIDRAGYNGRIKLAIDVAATDFCEGKDKSDISWVWLCKCSKCVSQEQISLVMLLEPDADMIMVEGISQLCNDLLVRNIYFIFQSPFGIYSFDFHLQACLVNT